MGFLLVAGLVVVVAVAPSCAVAQERRAMDVPDMTQRDGPRARQRLILKDGSFQVVFGYKVVGKLVRYQSAERNGETEDVPLALVDLPATERWKREHMAGAQAGSGNADRVVLSPALAKEEADRAARSPEVMPDLRLPEEDSVLALDTFQGTPELVPLPQQGSDLNRETAHATNKLALNPAASSHRILDLSGDKADVQLHVADPVFYVRVGKEDEGDAGGGGLVVDTHGASGRATPSGGAAGSDYVIERLDVRYDTRVVDSFRIAALGVKKQPDVIEVKAEEVPGGHWVKLTPAVPLEFGEYALVEVLSDRDVNLNVWDFGVHPPAREDAEAIRPEKRRPVVLKPRDVQ